MKPQWITRKYGSNWVKTLTLPCDNIHQCIAEAKARCGDPLPANVKICLEGVEDRELFDVWVETRGGSCECPGCHHAPAMGDLAARFRLFNQMAMLDCQSCGKKRLLAVDWRKEAIRIVTQQALAQGQPPETAAE